jgi:transposase
VAGPAPARGDAYKKTLAASERNEAERTAWREEAAGRAPTRSVFLDATGPHPALTRRYGWAPHDQRASGSVPRHHGQNTPVVVALTPDGRPAPWRIEGAMNTATFAWYLREPLAPQRQPGPGVGRENLSAHQAESLRAAIAARGGEVLFLPPSSPDFTPIEPVFSQIKASLRGLGARTKEALQEAVRLAIAASTRDDVAAWFAHAGYPLPDQGNGKLL